MAENIVIQPKDEISDDKKRDMAKFVIYAIQPALLYENCFGIFRLGLEDGTFTHTSGKKKLFGIFLAFIITIAFGLLIRIPPSFRDTVEVVTIMDEIPSILILVQYATTVVTTAFFLNEPTLRIFNNLVELDTKLRLYLRESFYSKTRKYFRNHLLIVTLIILFSFIIDLLTDEDILSYKFVTVTVYLQQNIEILMFCQMVFLIRSRLVIINEYLAIFVENKNSSQSSIFVVGSEKVISKEFNFIGRISPRNSKLRDLAELYDCIGETCSLINEVFEFQIFINLVAAFAHTVIAIWTTLYYSREPEFYSGQLVTVILWCSVTILSVTVISFTCERLLSTRQETKLLVNEIIMDYDVPKTMRVQAKVFMELIETCQMQIVIYDMFSIDIKLLLKFVSVATTYLIVIIQISHFV